MADWVEPSPDEVAARYDRLAPVYYAFEWLHALPIVRVRSRAVAALQLARGDVALEVGCGDGLNFARIERRIGPEGALLGIDVSQRMLARAARRAAAGGT
jgi:ubiquinone/menaquinone biosynthesis C-methylase UbiE